MSAISLLYAQDFYRWLLRNADLIRQGNFAEVDRENVAEDRFIHHGDTEFTEKRS